MAYLINLQTFSDRRGNLTVIDDIENVLPFKVKRIFYIYGVDNSPRGGHRHKSTVQAAVCLRGSCRVSNNDGKRKKDFIMDSPNKCLILEPHDWHVMNDFTKDAIFMVLASETFNPDDYIYEEYT